MMSALVFPRPHVMLAALRRSPGIRVFVSARCDIPTHALYTLLMEVRLHPHALERLAERGATAEEVRATVAEGEQFPAKYGRTGFRRNFPFKGIWHGRYYTNKQVEAYAVQEDGWLVITVMVKFF